MKRTVPNRMLFAETRDQLLAGREVVVRVLGQSMLPFFRSGSRITLRPLREGDLRRGHVVLGETDNGHFVVHRILTVGDERVTLLGDGNTVYSAYESQRVRRIRSGDTLCYAPHATRLTYAYPRSFYLTVSYRF